MSVRYLLCYSFFILVIYSCKTPEKPNSNPFAKYSKKERDSLAAVYDAFSNYMAQPTDAHRIAKDSAILAAPDNIELIQELSYSYKKRGEHIQAMKILNEAVAKDVAKGSIDALEYRAWSLIYFYRDYNGTIADVDLINKMSKRNYNICWGEPCGLLKGQALYKLGKYDEALSVFDNVLREEVKIGFKAEDNFLVHFYKGRCYHQLKKYQEALQSYEAVLKKDENYTEALYQVALVYKQLGEKVKAKSYLEKALFWVKKGKKMGEPYFERFDEVFEYQINETLSTL